jgi:hypothetical protein
VIRSLQQTLSNYKLIVEAFEAQQRERLCEIIQHLRSSLEADGNYGLAMQLPDALSRFIIIRLTRIYSNMSLESVAKKAGLDSVDKAEQYILNMVSYTSLL